MRVISKTGEHDIPYELSVFWRDENIIWANTPSLGKTIMAQYSAQEKAEKAMNMLHSYYGNYMVEKIYKQELCNVWPVFQFPKEGEL